MPQIGDLSPMMNVAEVWREFIVTEDLEVDVEQLLSGDQHPSMCRKCYSAYQDVP